LETLFIFFVFRYAKYTNISYIVTRFKDNKDPNPTVLVSTCIACLVSDVREELVSSSGIPGRPSRGYCLYVYTSLSLSSNSYSI